MPDPVIIVGAGLAGLSCATHLSRAGIPFLVLEASDAVGGRVRTDTHEGFLLDRGFQVLLTAYPEAQEMLDYARLELGEFYPGALIHLDDRFHRVADPWKRPMDAAAAFLSPVATAADKVRVGVLRQRIASASFKELWAHPEVTTLQRLQEYGFSQVAIDRFFRPFFSGVFFDRSLQTSSRMFEFVFRMFNSGAATIPARGMQAIPNQLADALPVGTVRLNTPVASVTPTQVTLLSGHTHAARAVVIATESHVAAKLLGPLAPPNLNSAWASTSTLYFSAPKPPVDEAILVLDASGVGPINHVAVNSLVNPACAPQGKHLISASTVGDAPITPQLVNAALAQMHEWFGPQVDQWNYLRAYHIPHALPQLFPPALAHTDRPPHVQSGLFIAGDHYQDASINGALRSGRRAAQALINDLIDDHR